jgi:hypothetical protein
VMTDLENRSGLDLEDAACFGNGWMFSDGSRRRIRITIHGAIVT